jgi:hypothetical protein
MYIVELQLMAQEGQCKIIPRVLVAYFPCTPGISDLRTHFHAEILGRLKVRNAGKDTNL